MKKKALLILIIPLKAFPAQQLTFNKTLLAANGISQSMINNVLENNKPYPGKNTSDIYINGSFISREVFIWKNNKIILPLNTFNHLGLNKEKFKETKKHGGGYLLNSNTKFKYSRETNSLDISLPSDYIKLKTESGISGGFGSFINYNIYGDEYNSPYSKQRLLSSTYQLGFNYDNLIIRSDGFFSAYKDNFSSYRKNQFMDFYADKNIYSSNLKFGRLIAPDSGFGVGYIDGLVLSSDGNFGSASFSFNYNAPKTLTAYFYQNNKLIYTAIIKKGDHTIYDIPAISLTNNVHVIIRDNGNVIDTRIISRGQLSLRKHGHHNYYIFAGRSVYERRRGTLGLGWGSAVNRYFNPMISLVNQDNKYNGLMLSNSSVVDGLNFNNYILTDSNKYRKKGINLTSSVSYKETSLSLAATSRHFSFINQYNTDYIPENKFNFIISQSFPFFFHGNMSVSLGRSLFYNQSPYNSLSTGINIPIYQASLSASVSYMSQQQGQRYPNQYSVNVNLTIPFNAFNNQINYNSNYYQYNNTQVLDNNISAPINDYYDLSVGSISYLGSNSENQYVMQNNFSTPYTNAVLTLSESHEKQYSDNSFSTSLSGSVALTHDGVIFSPDQIKNTYAVIDTNIHNFANVDTLYSSVKTNYNGKAIIADIPENTSDFVRVSSDDLPDDMIVLNDRRDFYSLHGSVAYFNFKTHVNDNLLLKWKNIPSNFNRSSFFYNDQGREIARFVDDGILLINKKDIPLLRSKGMTSPDGVGITCFLKNNTEDKNENIITANFNCIKKN